MKKIYFIILFAFISVIIKAQVCLKPTIYNSSGIAMATADFNNDGNPDLIKAYSDSIRTMLGDGLGGFTLGRRTITYYTSYVGRMISADFNKDNKADVAYTYGSNYIVVALGAGVDSFATPSLIQVGNNPYYLLSNDFNGDGNPDLVVANSGSNDVSVMLGDGVGNFGTTVNYTVGLAMTDITSGDFNSDGKPDLAIGFNTGNGQGGKIAIMLNDGTGGLNAPTNFTDGGV